MTYVLVKYVHIAGILVLFASLVLEHALIKPKMSQAEIGRIAIADLIYGASAAVVLIAGLLLWLVAGKGQGFYTHNPVFHAKIGIFVLVALASIYPTLFFIKNRKSESPTISVPRSITMIVRLELLLILLLPLLAILMAQGYGLG